MVLIFQFWGQTDGTFGCNSGAYTVLSQVGSKYLWTNGKKSYKPDLWSMLLRQLVQNIASCSGDQCWLWKGRRFSSVKITVWKKRVTTFKWHCDKNNLRLSQSQLNLGIKLALENHSLPYLLSGVSEFWWKTKCDKKFNSVWCWIHGSCTSHRAQCDNN